MQRQSVDVGRYWADGVVTDAIVSVAAAAAAVCLEMLHQRVTAAIALVKFIISRILGFRASAKDTRK
jgi:hypothetical protein